MWRSSAPICQQVSTQHIALVLVTHTKSPKLTLPEQKRCRFGACAFIFRKVGTSMYERKLKTKKSDKAFGRAAATIPLGSSQSTFLLFDTI
jgi:hypothetical protein